MIRTLILTLICLTIATGLGYLAMLASIDQLERIKTQTERTAP